MIVRKSLKAGKNLSFDNSENFIDEKDLKILEKIKELSEPLKKKYNINLKDIESLLEEELKFPDSILNEELTVLESVVKYLKENKNFSLKKISELIKRDQRNVWHIYHQAEKKYPKKFLIKEAKYWIPISIFSEKFSAYESLVKYLKDGLELKYCEIAGVLRRDQRTVWTIYNRTKEKNVRR